MQPHENPVLDLSYVIILYFFLSSSIELYIVRFSFLWPLTTTCGMKNVVNLFSIIILAFNQMITSVNREYAFRGPPKCSMNFSFSTFYVLYPFILHLEELLILNPWTKVSVEKLNMTNHFYILWNASLLLKYSANKSLMDISNFILY